MAESDFIFTSELAGQVVEACWFSDRHVDTEVGARWSGLLAVVLDSGAIWSCKVNRIEMHLPELVGKIDRVHQCMAAFNPAWIEAEVITFACGGSLKFSVEPLVSGGTSSTRQSKWRELPALWEHRKWVTLQGSYLRKKEKHT